MKKLVIAAATAALALGALVGCSSQPTETMEQTSNEVEEYIGVCMDKATQNRVDDENCKPEQTSPQYSPYFYSYGSVIPGLGLPMIGGYPTVYAPYYMGFSTTGGSSTNYQSKTPMAYPKGYVAPPNVVYKKSTPSSAPVKSAAEAATKYSAPTKSGTTSGSSSTSGSTGSKSSTNTTTKSNPYSYKGGTSTTPKSSSKK